MIENLYLRNFKPFPELDLDFSKLTILSGLNSSGKTSVIQALLLLRQSIIEKLSETAFIVGLSKMRLNGDEVEIGKAIDALYEGALSDVIEFTLKLSGKTLSVLAEYQQNKEYLRYKINKDKGIDDLMNLRKDTLFTNNFQHLTADRIVPKPFYDTNDIYVEKGKLGKRGEYTAHFLLVNSSGYNIENSDLLHPSQKSRNLKLQVEAWMNEFSPNHRFYIKPNFENNFVSIEYSKGNQGNRRLAPNVGFGLTYTLPVIVALLIAKRGDLLIIENPEAHLHPKGQTTIGKMAAFAANYGVQVILETHSDHVLNGARIAVRNGNISNKDVAVHFFYQKKGELVYYSDKETIPIDEDGRLEKMPEGFFDEFDKNLTELIIPKV
ncbi:MAG: DUF3696 domain-containing protein [Candidatus Zixiibacteriota bacterium]